MVAALRIAELKSGTDNATKSGRVTKVAQVLVPVRITYGVP